MPLVTAQFKTILEDVTIDHSSISEFSWENATFQFLAETSFMFKHFLEEICST